MALSWASKAWVLLELGHLTELLAKAPGCLRPPNATRFSCSLDGGELFSRIQDRGDQAFTERGMGPALWSLGHSLLSVGASLVRPISSVALGISSSCVWGIEEFGCERPVLDHGPDFFCSVKSRAWECFLSFPCASLACKHRNTPPRSKNVNSGVWFA